MSNSISLVFPLNFPDKPWFQQWRGCRFLPPLDKPQRCLHWVLYCALYFHLPWLIRTREIITYGPPLWIPMWAIMEQDPMQQTVMQTGLVQILNSMYSECWEQRSQLILLIYWSQVEWFYSNNQFNIGNWDINGPEGHPNNLQSAWHLTELFFWSDLSWLQAGLYSNSYVISTRFSLLSSLPSCTCYISYVGILCINHNVLFRISIIFDNMAIRPYRFSSYLWLFVFFWFLNHMYLSPDRFFWYFISLCVFNENKIVSSDSLLAWVLYTVCLGLS